MSEEIEKQMAIISRCTSGNVIVEDACDRISKEVRRLEKKPLPMTHPDLYPGRDAYVVFEGSCPIGGDHPADWCVMPDDNAVGWLPILDESME